MLKIAGADGNPGIRLTLGAVLLAIGMLRGATLLIIIGGALALLGIGSFLTDLGDRDSRR